VSGAATPNVEAREEVWKGSSATLARQDAWITLPALYASGMIITLRRFPSPTLCVVTPA